MNHPVVVDAANRARTARRAETEAPEPRNWRELRDEFLSAFETANARELAFLTGSTAKNPAARAYEWAKAGRIFGVNDGRQVRYPTFQLNEGRPIPEIAAVLRSLRSRGFSDWEIAMWFSKPNANLDDWGWPANALGRDPAMVATAAAAEAEEQVY